MVTAAMQDTTCSLILLRSTLANFRLGHVSKVIQLYETMLVRHGVMLVGPTGGGKTTVYVILADTLETLYRAGYGEDNYFYQLVKTYILNPKSVTMGELYGEVLRGATHNTHRNGHSPSCLTPRLMAVM